MNRLRSIVILCVAITLVTLSYNRRPIGYLHSWNQVTTLVHVSALSRDFGAWHKPYDVVTRLPAYTQQIRASAP